MTGDHTIQLDFGALTCVGEDNVYAWRSPEEGRGLGLSDEDCGPLTI